jgi:peptidyl-prolyl cis-trans isomerase D
MLLAIRERVMGLVGWILLGILAIAFSFFGLDWYMRSDSRVYAASVNDVDIPLAEQQRTYQLLRAQLQERLGEAYNPALIDDDMIRKSALEQLIREQLLLQEAEAEGFAISPQLVAARIGALQGFQEDGRFSKERYERVLRMQGMSPSEFEWRLSRELMTQQLVNGIAGTAAPTAATAELAYELQSQQRRFSHLTLLLARFMEKVEISDSELADWYENNQDRFMTAERVRVQYLELKAEDIEVPGDVDEEALQQLYQEQSERFVTPEERQARHILINLPADADDEATEAARSKAQSLLQRLDDGEDFAELARAESDDPGSAASGGDLGFFGRGLMTPEFEQVAFELEQGGRSGIVQSPFGFHIIEVTGIRPEVATPFEEVRAELVDEYLSEQRSELFYDRSELLANLVFEQPDTLQEAADALGLEVQTSDWLTREGGAGIGEYPQVTAMAFETDILEGGANSEPLEITAEHLVVIRNLEHEPATPRPLDEVSDEARQQLLDARARELTAGHGDELLARLMAGTPLADIATTEELEVTDSGLIGRQDQTVARQLLQEAFLLPEPVADSVSATGITLASGDYVLLQLHEVKPGDATSLSEADRKRLRMELARIHGLSESSAMVDDLRSRATIIIPEQDN